MFIDPRNTSRTCPLCNHIDKSNRHGEKFVCTSCGYTDDADMVGANNILSRGLDQKFIVSDSTKNGSCDIC